MKGFSMLERSVLGSGVSDLETPHVLRDGMLGVEVVLVDEVRVADKTKRATAEAADD
jgi:hypothetical protein